MQGSEIAADPKSIPSASELEAARPGGTTTPSQPSLLERAGVADAPDRGRTAAGPAEVRHADAPICMQCGVQMQRAGSCHACPSCGSTSGCS